MEIFKMKTFLTLIYCFLIFSSFQYSFLSQEDNLNVQRRVLMIENEMTFIRNRLGMFEIGRIPNSYLVEEIRKSLDTIDFYLGNTELEDYED
jgi:hypothetical protein